MSLHLIREVWTIGLNPEVVRREGIAGRADTPEEAYALAEQLATAGPKPNGFEHTEISSYGWHRIPGGQLNMRFVIV